MTTSDEIESRTQPWMRRDSAPHRGRLLSLLALASAVLAAMSCMVLPGLVALPLSLVVLGMARHDLRLIERGLMDPHGAGTTRLAREFSIVAIVLLVAMFLFIGSQYLLAVVATAWR